MQSFNTEQVLWPSYMSLKIGLYKWKHWHNLHYSIANSNAILYSLDKNVFLKEKSWSILICWAQKFLTKIIGTTILLKVSKVKSPGTDLGLHKNLIYKVWPQCPSPALGERQLRGAHSRRTHRAETDKKGVRQAGVGSPKSVTFLSQAPCSQKNPSLYKVYHSNF